jgi:hypothetical protein
MDTEVNSKPCLSCSFNSEAKSTREFFDLSSNEQDTYPEDCYARESIWQAQQQSPSELYHRSYLHPFVFVSAPDVGINTGPGNEASTNATAEATLLATPGPEMVNEACMQQMIDRIHANQER